MAGAGMCCACVLQWLGCDATICSGQVQSTLEDQALTWEKGFIGAVLPAMHVRDRQDVERSSLQAAGKSLAVEVDAGCALGVCSGCGS